VSRPRVALVGARRVRQGLGPFVARYLVASGAKVAGVLGRSLESGQAAAAELGRVLGESPTSYADLGQLIEAEAPHAIAILSPHETHEPYLGQALDSGLHVLCEKPLIQGGDGLVERAERLIDAFRDRGLLLVENCQWPEVLEAYTELFPSLRGAVPASFAMQLSPATAAPGPMLADALSHPLSVLQALAPARDPQLLDLRFDFRAQPSTPDLDSAIQPVTAGTGAAVGACLRVGFRFAAGAARVDTAIELLQSFSVPRPAGLGINGAWANREIREPDYTIHLTSGARSVKVPDPLGALVGRFVQQLHEVLSGRSPVDPTPVLERMRMFAHAERALHAACLTERA